MQADRVGLYWHGSRFLQGVPRGLRASILDPSRASRDLGVPAGWHLVALLCLGYPEVEHDEQGLERAGREPRERMAARVITV